MGMEVGLDCGLGESEAGMGTEAALGQTLEPWEGGHDWVPGEECTATAG